MSDLGNIDATYQEGRAEKKKKTTYGLQGYSVCATIIIYMGSCLYIIGIWKLTAWIQSHNMSTANPNLQTKHNKCLKKKRDSILVIGGNS